MATTRKTKKLTKDERISDEIQKLNNIFKNVPKDKLDVVTNLINNAAFMAATLEDLQLAINENGCVETYQNGANQFGKKKSSEVEIYNVMIKNYSSTIKQLIDLLPQDEGNSKNGGKELLNFIDAGTFAGGGTK
ncbi:MAG TPA: hypothetical protein VF941_07265 [Clostridia bacterium]